MPLRHAQLEPLFVFLAVRQNIALRRVARVHHESLGGQHVRAALLRPYRVVQRQRRARKQHSRQGERRGAPPSAFLSHDRLPFPRDSAHVRRFRPRATVTFVVSVQ